MGSVLKIIQSNSIKYIREQVEMFSQKFMKEYLDECELKCKNISLSALHTKNFYDSVWGTIEITEGEIYILDSPILQRLRHIKQLGLADVLYSGATHTRFSHTLGVLQTADVMAGQIQKELEKKNMQTEQEMRQVIRLAAIFHDCGHMFCSHASEIYFQKNRKASLYKKVESFRSEFQTNLQIRPSLSEIISVLIVNSPSIRRLLQIVQKGLKSFSFDHSSQDDLVEKIICMILGFPYSEKFIPYAKVISGQIDSDKLDYLKRDSHSTGVPVAVDMSRVFQKLRVVLHQKNYQMVAKHDRSEKAVYKMAIAPAAINTVDQLIISRFMMFENIYYHQKTLTAEEMLRYAMYKLDKSTKGLLDNFSDILLITDSAIINENFENYSDNFEVTKKRKLKKACDILRRLNKRNLFKRCVAFTDENMVQAIYKEKEFYRQVIAEQGLSSQEEFINEVRDEVIRIKNLLKDSEFFFCDETDILLISTPDISTSTMNSNISIDSKTNKDRNMQFEADNWLQSRASRKPQNYLVSYSEDRYLVYIAAEVVLLKNYGALINDTIIYTEDDERHIDKIKDYLNTRNYYNELYMLAPDSDIDTHMGEMKELVDKWKTYEIFDHNTGEGTRMDEVYLKMHLKQYIEFKEAIGNFNVFLGGYMKLLSKMCIISKSNITSALRGNLKCILEKEACSKEDLAICNIGNVQDSSAIVAYHMNMINNVLGAKYKTLPLHEVLKKVTTGQRIVFLEDAFCSGRQILSIFETYMGVPLSERHTQEIHVDELSDEHKEKLKKCKIFFSFIYYEKNNEEFFYKRLNEIGLEAVSIIAQQPFPDGYFKQDFEGNENAEIEIVKKYIKMAGHRLINRKSHDDDGNRKENWSNERMEESILGYNNAQQLIAFSWNTPTYTITPLWMSVDDSDFKWIPLFPRINK